MWGELYEEYAYYNVGVLRVKHMAVELFVIIYMVNKSNEKWDALNC